MAAALPKQHTVVHDTACAVPFSDSLLSYPWWNSVVLPRTVRITLKRPFRCSTFWPGQWWHFSVQLFWQNLGPFWPSEKPEAAVFFQLISARSKTFRSSMKWLSDYQEQPLILMLVKMTQSRHKAACSVLCLEAFVSGGNSLNACLPTSILCLNWMIILLDQLW